MIGSVPCTNSPANSDMQALGIFDEIEALVSDNLQVVSYKWLSRNFLVSSNNAKRLLQEFVEKKGSDLEVVYTLSGWLKNNPSVYHIRLVSGPKLEEAKQEFDVNCSVQVYSVQACIPKDPASLWNAEFVQAEELFKQSPMVVNCLRDNRFCGVSNSYVKRNAEGTHVTGAALLAKGSRVPGPSRSDSAHQTAFVPQPQQRKHQQLSPCFGLQSCNEVKDVKSESHGTETHEQGQGGKPAAEKEKVPQLPADEKKGQQSSGTGGSLASMWGRASVKLKPCDSLAENYNSIPNSAVNAEAEGCASEAVEGGSSDDDDRDINFKRASNGEGSRKRRVVFDFSDEEDEYKDAVSLASPDLPKSKSSLDSKQCSKVPSVDISLSFNEHKEGKVKVKEENDIKRESNQLLREESLVIGKDRNNGISSLDKIISRNPKNNACTKDKVNGAALNSSSTVNKGKNSVISSSNKIQSHIPEDAADAKNRVTDAAPNSPKRRKVLKTRIDERGREVTEVVWEGDESEANATSNTTMKASNNTVNTDNRQPAAAKKSSAVAAIAPSNLVGNAGNKKGRTKDPKQGNILSFFKKVQGV